jgi:hypothetical protein
MGLSVDPVGYWRHCGPAAPIPLLAISGEQGSAKTVLSKLLKALIDPNAAPVRALSREQRELMIAANNSYLLAFDNLSGLPHWLSDARCRLATGGSFAVRQLYTDDEEVLFEASRPTRKRDQLSGTWVHDNITARSHSSFFCYKTSALDAEQATAPGVVVLIVAG